MDIPPRNKDPSRIPDEMVENILEEVRAQKKRLQLEEKDIRPEVFNPDTEKWHSDAPDTDRYRPTPEAEPGRAPPGHETAPAVTEHEEPNTPPKKKKGLFWDIVFYAALIVLVLGVLLVKSGGNGAPVSVFGFSIHTVLSSSMQDEIPKDSLVLTRQVDPVSLQIGDDITYMKDETTSVTHRIVGIIEDYDGSGQRAFETQGIMNKEKDRLPVPAANVVGKVIFHSLVLGRIMSFLSQFWYLLILFLLLFTGLIWAVRSWRKAKKEETAGQDGKPPA